MHTMYRRWLYMLLAIIASIALFYKPALNFQNDKGIIYIRSFSMDQKTFYVTQTNIETGISEVTSTMSIKGLYYCYKAMLWSCIICFLCFFNNRWRIWIATISAFIAGSYYIIMIYYAIRMADEHCVTFYPNFMIILPAVICQMMILVRQNVIKDENDQIDKDMEEYAPV